MVLEKDRGAWDPAGIMEFPTPVLALCFMYFEKNQPLFFKKATASGHGPPSLTLEATVI